MAADIYNAVSRRRFLQQAGAGVLGAGLTLPGQLAAQVLPDGPAEGGVVPLSEWAFTPHGTILTPDSGAWDARFDHGSAGAVVKKGGIYLLYYIGADGDRDSDGGPAHRKLGVATATSLLGPWAKHPSNPLLAHSPNRGEEEGFWRVCAMVDDGIIYLYATVLTGHGGSVSGDIKLFTSDGGITFADQGIVLAHSDPEVFGSGDELGALGIYKATDGTFHLYYTAKSGAIKWVMGRAWGPAPDTFTDSEEAYTPEFEVGHGSNPIFIDGQVLIPVQDNAGRIEIHSTTESALGEFGKVEASYTSLGTDLGTFHRADKWYLFVSDESEGTGAIKLYTAPIRSSVLIRPP